ncbi:zinc-ribbon domain-containing protein [bacterium]|nr:zinc-ribbon domain-containing protein [bacterium]MBP9806785.1 zinc-ribbon domain-containing protein [bacterium]
MSAAHKRIYIEDVVEPARIRTQSFAKAFPAAAAMWDHKKNCGFGPEDFSFRSHVRAWFKCPKGRDHRFQVQIAAMANAMLSQSKTMGCGFCNSKRVSVTNNLAETYPEIAKEWMPKKNKLSPQDVPAGSCKYAWWKCPKGHTYEAQISNRTAEGTGCVRCNVGEPLDLRTYPRAYKEFDRKQNKGVDPHCLSSTAKYAWNCSADPRHHWIAGFYRDSKNRIRCPFCRNQKGSPGNNLKASHPHLAKQWHPTKNGDTTAKDVTFGSGFKAWWKCHQGPDHEWQTSVANRTGLQTDCPFCKMRRTSVTNIISTQAPKLAKEWHPRKNGKIKPDQVRIHSMTQFWWLCSKCSFEWRAAPIYRITRGNGCPQCARKKHGKMMSKRLKDNPELRFKKQSGLT